MPPPVHGAGLMGQYIQESKLLKSTFDCDYINLSTSNHLNEIGKFGFKKLIGIVKLIFKVLKTVSKKRYDLCYMTINAKGSGWYKEMIIVFLLKLLRYPLVYHYHNKGVSTNQNNWLLNKLYGYQFKNSRIILLSSRLYYDIEKYVPKEKVYYCPYGIPIVCDIDLCSVNLKRTARGVPELLFLSNMMEEKGVYTLLEASKLLFNEGISFKTYFVGASSDVTEADFNKFISLNNLQNNVEYVGKKYNDEKSIYFEQADIFVFPTYYHNETFGLVNLEAMQYGLPIISTNEGAIPDLVEDGVNGFIIPKKDAKTLANKIEFLINNPDICKEMGKNGRKRFEDKYTLDIFEQNYVKTMQQIITDFDIN